MNSRIKMGSEENTICFSDVTDEALVREITHLSGCSFKPYKIVKVDGVSFSVATHGIDHKNIHIHFSSYMFHFYAFLKTKENYDVLKNNVLKEKLRS